MNREEEKFIDDIPENVLTGIHPSYTVSGTHDGSEVDELIVNNFLQTLAEIALSIASREVKNR